MKHREIEKRLKRLDRRWKRLRAGRDDPDSTKRYTPQDVEALLTKGGNGAGIIRPETGDLHLPSNVEALGESEQTNAPHRVMLVIITLALSFIAIITYFVSRMPNKD